MIESEVVYEDREICVRLSRLPDPERSHRLWMDVEYKEDASGSTNSFTPEQMLEVGGAMIQKYWGLKHETRTV